MKLWCDVLAYCVRSYRVKLLQRQINISRLDTLSHNSDCWNRVLEGKETVVLVTAMLAGWVEELQGEQVWEDYQVNLDWLIQRNEMVFLLNKDGNVLRYKNVLLAFVQKFSHSARVPNLRFKVVLNISN